ncbi:DUF397 domain-containing protein [Streptomyces sp. SBT349]|uniref:DUF397 domain-containing protein n=1 Tax=Streptomyces sp. SBT349 TaxID=1580539 RepID=UPI00066CFB60|nr:DUF397 domain-containing protein [Streptomyces sp. SBT349]
MIDLNAGPTAWVTSSYSGNGGNCVECAPRFASLGAVPVRDSKDPAGPALSFPTSGWSGFLTALKQGHL